MTLFIPINNYKWCHIRCQCFCIKYDNHKKNISIQSIREHYFFLNIDGMELLDKAYKKILEYASMLKNHIFIDSKNI